LMPRSRSPSVIRRARFSSIPKGYPGRTRASSGRIALNRARGAVVTDGYRG
jgi:hypothetical protein